MTELREPEPPVIDQAELNDRAGTQDAPAAQRDAELIPAPRQQEVRDTGTTDDQQADNPPPSVDGPHESPESWAGDINPADDRANCGDCARASQQTWEGDPRAAAMSADTDGEPPERMAEWAGETPREVTMAEVGERLQDLGPGSSAIVGFDREDDVGHWFNAVNDDGEIKAVDGQSGAVEPWPPTVDGLGFSEAEMSYSDAIFFDPSGRTVT